MDMVVAFFTQLWELAQAGFSGVNQVLGLLIALVMALVMHGWRDLWRMAAGAAVIQTIIAAILPMLDGGQLAIPNVLTLSHSARDRALFARGAVLAGLWVKGRAPGLYGMQDVLGFRQA